MCVCIYICVCVCVFVYIYIYIYLIYLYIKLKVRKFTIQPFTIKNDQKGNDKAKRKENLIFDSTHRTASP